MNNIPKAYITAALVGAGILCLLFVSLNNNPKVIVYLDKDAKQPAILPLPEDTIVKGERAALWWTVFNKCLERTSVDSARYIANDAVKTVYGEVK